MKRLLTLSVLLTTLAGCTSGYNEFNPSPEVFQARVSGYDDYRVWHLAGLIASQSGNQEQATIYLKQTHQLYKSVA